VKAAKACGIRLRQTFAEEGKQLRFKSGGYAHAKQFTRLKRVVKRQRTIVGILIREVRAKLSALDTATHTNTAAVIATGKAVTLLASLPSPSALGKLTSLLARAEQIRTQTRHTKNKLYALHAPEVECISKGKARNRYEFGVKVSLAITHQQGLMVGAKRFTGNPFDGHTLNAQLKQTNGLIAASGKVVKEAVVDLGYRGVDQDNVGVDVIHRGRIKSMSHGVEASSGG
jgi:transposase, IS5 family